jgi:hypothetical protein
MDSDIVDQGLHDLFDRGLEVHADQAGLLGLQPGAPIDLDPIAFRVVKIDADGVPVADLHVQPNAVFFQPIMEGDHILQRFTVPRHLLPHQGPGRNVTTDNQNQFVVLELRVAAEKYGPARSAVGHLQRSRTDEGSVVGHRRGHPIGAGGQPLTLYGVVLFVSLCLEGSVRHSRNERKEKDLR